MIIDRRKPPAGAIPRLAPDDLWPLVSQMVGKDRPYDEALIERCWSFLLFNAPEFRRLLAAQPEAEAPRPPAAPSTEEKCPECGHSNHRGGFCGFNMRSHGKLLCQCVMPLILPGEEPPRGAAAGEGLVRERAGRIVSNLRKLDWGVAEVETEIVQAEAQAREEGRKAGARETCEALASHYDDIAGRIGGDEPQRALGYTNAAKLARARALGTKGEGGE